MFLTSNTRRVVEPNHIMTQSNVNGNGQKSVVSGGGLELGENLQEILSNHHMSNMSNFREQEGSQMPSMLGSGAPYGISRNSRMNAVSSTHNMNVFSTQGGQLYDQSFKVQHDHAINSGSSLPIHNRHTADSSVDQYQQQSSSSLMNNLKKEEYPPIAAKTAALTSKNLMSLNMKNDRASLTVAATAAAAPYFEGERSPTPGFSLINKRVRIDSGIDETRRNKSHQKRVGGDGGRLTHEQLQMLPSLNRNKLLNGGIEGTKGNFSQATLSNTDHELRSIQNMVEGTQYETYNVRIPMKRDTVYESPEDKQPSNKQMIDLGVKRNLKSNFLNFIQDKNTADENQEFQENVMHILDRSHNKYKMQIKDDYIIDSAKAKKKFKKESASPSRRDPTASGYESTNSGEGTVGEQKQNGLDIAAIIPLKSKRDKNAHFTNQVRESRTQSRLSTMAKQVNLLSVKSQLSKTPLKSQKEDYFLPDIKDYHRIIERGIEKIDQSRSLVRNYDEWCNLVKLCFDGGQNKRSLNTVNVASLELMRLHPVFNRLSFYGVRDFLQECKLVKLRANQLLYRQDDIEDSVFIIIFGKLVLHHRTLGALGVVGMGQTIGEEALLERSKQYSTTPTRSRAVKTDRPNQDNAALKRKDAAYAQTESYLLEIGSGDWKRVKEILLRGGSGTIVQGKTDVLHFERLLQQNYQQKNLWRMNKEREYVNIEVAGQEDGNKMKRTLSIKEGGKKVSQL